MPEIEGRPPQESPWGRVVRYAERLGLQVVVLAIGGREEFRISGERKYLATLQSQDAVWAFLLGYQEGLAARR